MTSTTEVLALQGGAPAVTKEAGDIFAWPIVTTEDEEAVLEVLRRGAMSGNDVSKAFEAEFAAWIGLKHALTYPNGTESLRAAMWACGVGAGDEIICPSMTYWASCTSALSLGAAVNFADIDPETLCIDPKDIEHRIGPRTKAIVVVHYAGYPAPMDAIMPIARKHGVLVIEDVSHAHGALYKGRMVGTFGDIAAMSMMAGKSFAIGEAGMMATNNGALYERCISYGFYERTGVASRFNAPDSQITMEELKPFAGVPLGGFKHRLNQTCAAMGRVQLKYYDARTAEIQSAMNRFWDLLDGVPGLRAHRPAKDSGSTMGGWYSPRGLYRAEELGGLPVAKFCEAVRAEMPNAPYWCHPGANFALHLHQVFHTADIFRMGQPTMISFGQRDVRQGPGTLPVSERIGEIAFGIPWFKHDRPEIIAEYAAAYRKVAEHADALR
ncbi:MAG: L-glutamine:2-deoxy-scyllo-inosose aminotransferase [bacterium ADurb.Bin429]|nr:MAG: L-glutamine:2-deoxy-scyllo-inosose aminotransferase [bacterium ADurb.Bin429]